MLDSALFYETISRKPEFDLPEKFILSTIHRAENTDDPQKLKSIFAALSEISQKTPIVLPLHPRTKKIIEDLKTCPAFDGFKTCVPGRIVNLILVEPVEPANRQLSAHAWIWSSPDANLSVQKLPHPGRRNSRPSIHRPSHLRDVKMLTLYHKIANRQVIIS